VTVLVTGGAGYIGAHVVRCLIDRGDDVVVVDDLSTGDEARVPDVRLIELDLSDRGAATRLVRVMGDLGIRSVVHLAAKKRVSESVVRPTWYYRQNVGGMIAVLAAMRESGVDRLVFSSSAAVYGSTDERPVDETAPAVPINPYGETKLVGEWLVRNASRAWGLRGLSLRYFNVAGAGSPELGDPEELNLVTIAMQRLRHGERPVVFGRDYPTRDGTGVRDYVHVEDLAEAHLAALDYLDRPIRDEGVFNVGTGTGASVLEVLSEIERVSGIESRAEFLSRRPGDPASVVACVDRICEVLGWRARHSLGETVASAWGGRVASD